MPSTKSRGYLAYALSLNYAAMVSLAIAVNLLPIFLTTLGTDLGGDAGLTKEQLGRIGGVTFAGLVVAIFATGPIADRIGAKPFAVLGNLLIAAGLGVLGVAEAYWHVLAAVFIMGLGAGMLDMVLTPIVAAIQPDNRTSAMNWLHSFYCTGAVLTALLASVALSHGIGWRTLSLGMIAMPLAVGIGFVTLAIPPLVAEGQQRTRLRQLFREPFFLMALAAIFLGGATELGMQQWLPAYAETSLLYSPWTGGMALVGFSAAMAVGRIGAGLLGGRLDPIRLMLWCCAASVVLFLVACYSPALGLALNEQFSVWSAIALGACVLAGLTGSCLWPSTCAVAADRFPHGGASMYAVLAALGNSGGIFMPWIVGLIADHSTLSHGLATAALCPALMIVILLLMQRRLAVPIPQPMAVTDMQA